MSGTKRSHGDFLADDAASDPSFAGGYTSPQRTQPSIASHDGGSSKKLKTNHSHISEEPDKTSRVLQGTAAATVPVGSKKKHRKKQVKEDFAHPTSASGTTQVAAKEGDQEMSDSDMEASPIEDTSTQHVAQSTDPTQIQTVRADDLANNPYAPQTTNAGAVAAYIQEVGTRNVYLNRTPLQTPTSAVKDITRHLIYDRLFKNWSNKQCREAYNQRGGNVASDQGVSRPFLKYAPIWFEEENVVLPWDARGKKEQDLLTSQGLGRGNFPLVCIGSPALSNQLAPSNSRPRELGSKKTVKQHSTVKVAPQKEADSGFIAKAVPQQHHGDTNHSPSDSLNHTDSQERPRNHDDQHPKIGSQEADSAPRASTSNNAVEVEDIEEESDDDDEDEVDMPGSMRDRVRAAFNVFGRDLATFSLGDKDCTLLQSTLFKYCGTVRDQASDFEINNFSPRIVQAFASAISPCPGNGLPLQDFDFRKHTLTQGVNSDDVLGVMNSDTVVVTDFVWTMDACVEMHELCVAMDCDIVQDMVVDKVCELYAEHVESETASDFLLPITYMDELESDEDEPFLRLLVDIMVDQNAKGVPFPEKMSAHVADMVARRKDEQYRQLVQAQEIATKHLITQFFDLIMEDAAKIDKRVYASIPRKDYHKGGRQLRRRDLVRWSQCEEEKTAHSLYKLEMLNKYRAYHEARGNEIDEKHRHEKKKLQRLVAKSQHEHNERWDCFEGRHIDCEHTRPSKSDAISLVPKFPRDEW